METKHFFALVSLFVSSATGYYDGPAFPKRASSLDNPFFGVANQIHAIRDSSSCFNPASGVDVGNYSSPVFVDLNTVTSHALATACDDCLQDGDVELVVGSLDGTLAYYMSSGTGWADATTNPFQGVT